LQRYSPSGLLSEMVTLVRQARGLPWLFVFMGCNTAVRAA
jgi:hypothetical protein